MFDSERVESIYEERDFLPPSKQSHRSSSGLEAVPRSATSLLNLEGENDLFDSSDVAPLENIMNPALSIELQRYLTVKCHIYDFIFISTDL